MTVYQIGQPFPLFNDINGDPLDNGFIYIGEEGKDPTAYPIQVYWDEDLTIPAVQPLQTLNGYIVRNGTPSKVFCANNFSILIQNSNGIIVAYSTVGFSLISPVSETTLGFVRKATDAEVLSGDPLASDAFLDPSQAKLYLDTLSDLGAYTGPHDTIYIKGRTSDGDGGQGVWILTAGNFTTELAADTLNGRYLEYSGEDGSTRAWVRQLNGYVTPEMFGGDLEATGIMGSFLGLVVHISRETSLSSDVTLDTNVIGIKGTGWTRDANIFEGSFLSGTGGVLLSSLVASFGLIFEDLGFDYTGAGTALTIDNILNSQIKNVFIDCNSVGAVGIDYSGTNSYFSVLENSTISSFTDYGVVLNSTGTKHVIKDCNIGSAQATATAAVEVNVPGVSIYDGQINIDRADNLGVGILFNNLSGAAHQGGIVEGTVSEKDIGIKITGTTHGWYNVILRNTRYTMGGTSTAVIFDRAIECILENPSLFGPTANFLAEFTANSIRCGIIGGYEVGRANLIVSASAVGAYKIVNGYLTYAERSNITTYPALKVTCNDVEYVGKTVHNGVAWDKVSVSIADDNVTTLTPPQSIGQLEIRTTTGGNDYILCNYNVTAGSCIGLTLGALSAVNSTDGTLSGTTGADTYLTVRCSSSGVIYVENRRGSNRRIIAEFK